VRHGDNGLLVPYVDHAALVAALRAAFDGDTRARLAANAGAQLDRFAWDTMVTRTINLLESVCTS
jgi:glycosyltransferase involved in cell wall biosynthesis